MVVWTVGEKKVTEGLEVKRYSVVGFGYPSMVGHPSFLYVLTVLFFFIFYFIHISDFVLLPLLTLTGGWGSRLHQISLRLFFRG